MTSFKPLALRLVRPAWADQVPSPAHDSLSPAQRRKFLEANPNSYLTVTRSPEDDAVKDDAVKDDAVKDGAPKDEPNRAGDELLVEGRAAFERLISADVFTEKNHARFYVYRLTAEYHSQTGIVGGISIADYESGELRVHEQVRHDRTEHLARHLSIVESQSSPIAVSYRESQVIAAAIDRAISGAPLVDATGPDGLQQRVWPIDATDEDAIADELAGQPTYIIDGHHRAAAGQAYHRDVGGQASSWILAAAFSSDQLLSRAYHRELRRLNIDQLISSIDETLAWREMNLDSIEDRAADEIAVAGADRWLAVKLPFDESGSSPAEAALNNLDPVRLERQLLKGVLGIEPTDSAEPLTYRPGNRPLATMTARTKRGLMFINRPVPVDLLLSCADAGLVMPPKSTYFEPKVRSGVFVRSTVDSD